MKRVLSARSRSRTLRTSRLLAIPVAVLLTLLAACTGGGNGPDTPTAGTSTSAAESVAADINPQPRNVLADGGELRLSVPSFGDQWNPLHKDAADVHHRQIMGSLVPRLFNYDAEGNPSPNPEYLSAVHASGENPQVVTYTLNPNAQWGNGRQLSADDFIANWEACNGQNVSFDCDQTEHLAEVSSIEEGTSPQQVVVTYSGAYDDWPSTFYYLLPEESVKDPETFNDGWSDLNDLDDWLAGPFVVSSYNADDDVLIENPNPEWWADPPNLSQLTFRKVRESDLLQSFTDHHLDVADISHDSDEVEPVNEMPDAEVRQAIDPDTEERQLLATRTALANYGAFGEATVVWPDVGFLPSTN
jgi:peptide/nickel transport system substrate-binding protein